MTRAALAVLAVLAQSCSLPAPPEPHALGRAAFPAETPSARDLSHRWSVARRRHTLKYALGVDAEGAVVAKVDEFARSVGHVKSGTGFRWAPAGDCRGGRACIHEAMTRVSAESAAPLARRFRAHVARHRLTPQQTAELVVSYVQAIRYRIPEDQPFGILAPSLVAYRGHGDCDSKALLAQTLLRGLGVPTVIFVSQKAKHAVLGIPVAVPGSFLVVDGRRYALAETTSTGWPIGRIEPKLARLDDWKPMRLRPKRLNGTGVTDLGRSTFPAGAGGSGTLHLFRVSRWPSLVRLRYALGPEAASKIEADQTRFLGRVQFKKTAAGFQWHVPPKCGAELQCVYRRFLQDSQAALEPVLAALNRHAEDEALRPDERAELVVRLVQSVPYETSDALMTPPALILSLRKGDARGKALLAHMLLEGVGLESVVLHHTAADQFSVLVAVAVPTEGHTVSVHGRPYAVAVTSNGAWPVGAVPPEMQGKGRWVPITLRR